MKQRPKPPVVLDAPSVGDRYLQMLQTARTVAQTTHEPIRILWLFPSVFERDKAARFLRHSFERRTELEVETPKSTTLGIYMRYVGNIIDPSENEGV